MHLDTIPIFPPDCAKIPLLHQGISFYMLAKMLLLFVTVLFVGVTIMPFVRSDYWTFRILEYPRLQKLFLGAGILVLLLLFRQSLAHWFWWMVVPLCGCLLYLLFKITPYTFAGSKQMKAVSQLTKDSDIKIFTANVLQKNLQYNDLLQQIKAADPDIVFLVETNQQWKEALQPLTTDYPNTLFHPLDNTYGLLFYSRLPLTKKKIRFIVKDDIPSVDVTALLPNGKPVRLIGLHPEPPVPGESMYSTAKDKELMKVAMEIEHFTEPCIVMGDLNDVAWSHVTELFQEVSSLLDPRRGRGFYSTFNAKHWWMRFPLDYIFCSSHFGLVSMKRMPYNGSDHFPMFIHLQYDKTFARRQEKPEADEAEKEEATEKAGKATVPQ